jgi:hypothetical protein
VNLIVEYELSESIVRSLKFFSIKTERNVSETVHDEYIKLANAYLRQNATDNTEGRERRRPYLFGPSWMRVKLIVDDSGQDTIQLLSAYAATRQLRDISGVRHIRIPCCINSCIAYTGDYSGFTHCPFCEQPRLNGGNIPRQTFDYIPITHRLRLQYANSARAKKLREYRKRLQNSPWEGVRDYWDGALHQEHKAKGYFSDERDIALGLSTDGLQLFDVGKYSVWPVLLVNLNLEPQERVKKRNLFSAASSLVQTIQKIFTLFSGLWSTNSRNSLLVLKEYMMH